MFDMNNGFVGYPTQPQMQFNGIQPQAMPKRNNVLTDEEIKKLQANRTQFTLTITEDEHLRAACNHRTADGMNDALEYDPSDPSAVVCKICGQKFVPISTDSPADYVQDITDQFVNLLQTIKIMFVDFPVDAARTFFDIIPMAQKTPELFAMASKNLAKYENYGAYGYQGASQSAMGLLNSFIGMMGSGQTFGAPAQPVYGQPAPNANPVFNNQATPFGYPGAQPTYGYQPGTTGFAYNPAQQAAPQPQAQPAAESTTTTTTNAQA